MQNKTKARSISLLLILAMLIVCVAVLLPVATAAEPASAHSGEIERFGVQTLTALDLAGDVDTDLRFVFTVGSLAYDEVGFVFSKTNASPTIGGDGCVKKATTTVYSAILASGTPDPAGDGRYWVAVKLTDIPHAYFDGALYVRPYVDDGEVRYGDAMNTTVCSAAEHKHSPQLLPGHCDGCNLDGVKSGEPSIWNSNDKNSGNKVDKRTYQSIRGEDHFCPDESNNNQGNDLLIEFSILYNETLLDNSDRTFDITIGDGSDFINLKLGSNANARYGTVVGGFSARNRSGDGMTLIYPTSEMIAADPDAKYPSIGAYGWHRVGVRVHEEANIVSDNVRYTLIGTLYLDGEPVLEFDLSTWANNNSNANALLYTATIENDQLVYTDNDASTRSWGEFGIYGFYGATDVYLGIADAYMTCGKTFVQQVEAVAAPEAASIEIDGNNYPAAIYYRFAD